MNLGDSEIQGHLLTISLIQLVLSLTFLAPSVSSFVIALPMLALSLVGFIGAIKEKRTFIGIFSLVSICNAFLFGLVIIYAAHLVRHRQPLDNPIHERHTTQMIGMKLSLTLFFFLFSILSTIISTIYYRQLCHGSHVRPQPESFLSETFMRLRNAWNRSSVQHHFSPAPPTPHSSPPECPEEETCRYCNHRQAVVVSLGCGHLSLCEKCSRRTRVCPTCRQGLRNTVHVYQT
ncbi:hypothetical protein P9112_009865 [Eukaryota sp. TZLM1-RC]